MAGGHAGHLRGAEGSSAAEKTHIPIACRFPGNVYFQPCASLPFIGTEAVRSLLVIS
jgi:hypothetical protein